MKRETIESSNIKSLGYDPETETLEVEFNSGQIYQYEGVNGDLHQNLINAESVGSFFHSNIKGFKSKKL
jgi:hypothetical protein